MALELRQQLRMSQQLVMTPQLQMAIKLLQLSHLELLDVIRDEMEQNAALEEGEELSAADRLEIAEAKESAETEPPPESEINMEENVPADLDWVGGSDDDERPGQVRAENEDREFPKFENFLAKRESLSDHLLWQVMLRFSDEVEKNIGQMIVGNLTRDGYLDAGAEDIARICRCPEETVRGVLAEMQTFDPLGVCARDLKECLRIQLRALDLSGSLADRIVKDHLPLLENKNYKAIAQAEKVTREEVAEAVAVITALEPRPGRPFSEEEPHYIVPDIFVYKMGEEYEIILNDDGLPKLHISRFYKKALLSGEGLSPDAKNYVQGKLRGAAWLIRSIHQRQRTIYRVMESIVKFQRDFLDKGILHLKPMVLRDVAEDIQMHESTISRVTTNKYAHTPQGIFELKFFFNSSINRHHGPAVASASVKDRIARIIKDEDPKKPFSDDKIAEMLSADNIQIARRTVAKYREMLGILPSSKRRAPI
ncbi:MAG: RNA polymerase factor sigma-54 [Thermodesulfobacteriota bacterium]